MGTLENQLGRRRADAPDSQTIPIFDKSDLIAGRIPGELRNVLTRPVRKARSRLTGSRPNLIRSGSDIRASHLCPSRDPMAAGTGRGESCDKESCGDVRRTRLSASVIVSSPMPPSAISRPRGAQAAALGR